MLAISTVAVQNGPVSVENRHPVAGTGTLFVAQLLRAGDGRPLAGNRYIAR